MSVPFKTKALYGVLGLLLGAVSACDSVTDTPTKPSPALTVEVLSSATTLDQFAIGVQLRLRVTEGLEAFTNAVRSGAGQGEVCVDDECATQVIVLGQVAGACNTAVGFGTVEMAAAWLDGDVVGIDFCVTTLTTAETYRTTVGDGQQQSNAVETDCAQGGGFLVCGAG